MPLFDDARLSRFKGAKHNLRSYNIAAKSDVSKQRFPSFWCKFTDFGIAQLSPSLTINGQTETPVLRYVAGDAYDGGWLPDEFGIFLEQSSGTTSSFNKRTPLPGDFALKFNADAYYGAGVENSDFADITTEDFVIECIFRINTHSANQMLFAKRLSTGGLNGYSIAFVSASKTIYLVNYDADGNYTVCQSGAIAYYGWNHLLVVANRDGYAQMFINGYTSGDSVDISELSSFTTPTPFTIGCRDDKSLPSNSYLAYVSLWKKDDWLDTHEQETLAQQRCAHLFGLYPEYAGGEYYPTLYQRNSTAYYDEYQGDDTWKLIRVGNNWMRTGNRVDENGNDAYGIYIEKATTNLFHYSYDVNNAYYSKAGCSITNNNNVLLPFSGDDVSTYYDTVVEDDVADQLHGIQVNSVDITKDLYYTFSVFVKAINRRYISVWARSFQKRGWFDLQEGTVLTSSNATARIKKYSNGWYRLSISFTYTATESCQFALIGFDEGDFEPLQWRSAGLNGEAYYAWGFQLEQSAFATSYYETGNGTGTRPSDIVRYSADKNLDTKGRGGTIMCSFHQDIYTNNIGDEYPVLLTFADEDNASTDYLRLNVKTGQQFLKIRSRASGGDNGDRDTTTDILNNTKHDIIVQYQGGKTFFQVDGTYEGSSDTSSSIPDDIDIIDIGGEYISDMKFGGIIFDLLIFNDWFYPRVFYRGDNKEIY